MNFNRHANRVIVLVRDQLLFVIIFNANWTDLDFTSLLLIGKVHLIKSFHQWRRPCERERERMKKKKKRKEETSCHILFFRLRIIPRFSFSYSFVSHLGVNAEKRLEQDRRRRYPSLPSPLSSLSFSRVIIGWLEFSLYLTKTAVGRSFFSRHSLAWPMKTKMTSSILWVWREIEIFIDRLHF